MSKTTLFFALIALLLGACGYHSESSLGDDAGTDADTRAVPDSDCDPAGACCNRDGTSCEHGCDGTNCWPDCNPADPCCEPDGTMVSWYDSNSGLCWQDPPSATAMNWFVAVGVYHATNNDTTESYCTTLGSGWRIPTISELRSLVRRGTDTECETIEWDTAWAEPDIVPGYCGVWDSCLGISACFENSECIPDTCGTLEGPGVGGCYWDAALSGTCSGYWSEPEAADHTDYAWDVGFDDGYVSAYVKDSDFYVRCARSELECDPGTDGFCCESNGTWKTKQVKQPGTNLYWLRCHLGQAWVEGESCGCTDSPGSMRMNWCEASGVDAPDGIGGYYCQSDHDDTDICAHTYPSTDWRLPTAGEYSVLLEETGLGNGDGKACNGVDGDTMCTDMFGYNSGTYHWSSSSYDDDSAWNASLFNGFVVWLNKASDYNVRCMRTGP